MCERTVRLQRIAPPTSWYRNTSYRPRQFDVRARTLLAYDGAEPHRHIGEGWPVSTDYLAVEFLSVNARG
jgi:hypothetical protein